MFGTNEYMHIIILMKNEPLYYNILYIYIYDTIIQFYISFKIKLNKLLIRNNSKHQVYILTSCVIFIIIIIFYHDEEQEGYNDIIFI